MPLDTSSYSLALLRLDGRRWNELRRIHAQISTQPSADGSSYLEMGNTKVICIVSGPAEGKRGAGAGGGGERDQSNIVVEISVAGFSGVDRKRRRNDRRTTELQHTITQALQATVYTSHYGGSTITISLHVLAQDGALLAACINAATLALIDAGVPMSDYLVACTAGSTTHASASAPQKPVGQQASIPGLSSLSGGGNFEDTDDPLLDLNGLEEQELPFLTVATLGGERDAVVVCLLETRVHAARVEEMLAVGVDGCKRVREILDGVVRVHGRRMVEGG
ncbi:ribosomal protein S5 domain 2-like protein [Trichodelitschia bisporula]|uniref:Ribosomal protein S5 domain 2-like protein n=1 Tax=Trichodelitschia bisporula TaxID=703511 RepID=A0A6G1I7H6_9PEZI|nr:ribosomal protein S5 domain 2-like protein [Trichodelitschia bisporula]